MKNLLKKISDIDGDNSQQELIFFFAEHQDIWLLGKEEQVMQALEASASEIGAWVMVLKTYAFPLLTIDFFWQVFRENGPIEFS